MFKRFALLCLLALFFLSASAPAADPREPPNVAESFNTPMIAVPYLTKAPTLDGVVNDSEWQAACSVNALRHMRGAVSGRPTRYWLGWDEQNLYIAMRSPLRKGERPIQKYRGMDGDPMVIFDDGFEFYFDTGGTLAGGLPAYIQYIGNFAGAKYDAAHLPTVGIRRLSYEAGWQPRSRLAETEGGRAWEMEVAIPYKSILMTKPYADGTEIRALLARNFKRPWEQNSIEAASVFRNSATYTVLRLSKGIPAVHILSVADRKQQTVGLKLAAYGTHPAEIDWNYRSDSGLDKEGTLTVLAGKWQAGPDLLGLEKALAKPGKQAYRIQVATANGKRLLFDWLAYRGFGGVMPDAKSFDDDRGDQVSLSLQLNPIKDYLRVTGDLINFDARDQIAASTLTIQTADGRAIETMSLKLDAHAYLRDTIQLPGLKPGKYVARIVCRDEAGNLMFERQTAFEKKDHAKAFPWWNSPKGNIETVIPPWTPVSLDQGTLSVWGRTMTIGSAGLPATVGTQGKPLLQGPAVLQATLADGQTVQAENTSTQTLEQADHRVVQQVLGKLGAIAIKSRVTTEFDGMYKVEMTLTPQQAVTVKTLQVRVPLRNDRAEYLTACGEGIRWGYDNRLLPPDARGEIWNCRKVDGQRLAVGSFIPYVWVGDSFGGLCWYADSDKGWVPNDKVPAIVIQRDTDDSTDLVFNLISDTFRLEEPRTIVFAFQATPIKKLVPGWRRRVYSFGDTFQDWQCAQSVGSSRMRAPVPWSFDPDKCRKMVKAYHQRPRMLNIHPSPAIPYGRHNELIPRHMPEAKYFAEHWNSSRSWHIFYSRSLTDYWIDKLDRWIKECDIDGYYSDNTHPSVCFNVEAGRGYYLPDGRIQPAYNIFGIREYFLRMRAVFAENGKQGWIVTHMTHNMVIPWLGACDIALDGEDHTVTPSQNQTWLDHWPLERLRADIPRALGVATTFKTEFTPLHKWSGGRYDAKDIWRSYAAGLMLHDAVPMTGYGLPNTWFKARHHFGIGADDVEFLGYWERNSGIQWDLPDKVAVSAWKRPNRLLLLAVGKQEGNHSLVTTTIQIDHQKLGLPKPTEWYVFDAEALSIYTQLDADGTPIAVRPERGHAVELGAKDTLTLTVPRHDYRMIIIQPKTLPRSKETAPVKE